MVKFCVVREYRHPSTLAPFGTQEESAAQASDSQTAATFSSLSKMV